MKKDEDGKTSLWNKFKFSSFFENLYYFFLMHIYVVLGITGAAIGIAVILFFAELFFPKYVHIFNYSITEKTFHELVNEKRYRAAISFLEFKSDVIENSNEPYKFRMELADCYVHIGDYTKALEQYDLLRDELAKKLKQKNIQKKENLSAADVEAIESISEIDLIREKFKIYLKMGDRSKILDLYRNLDILQKSVNWEKAKELVNNLDDDELKNFDIRDGFQLELIQGLYYENPRAAISHMREYVERIFNSPKYNQRCQLRCLNILIGMSIEQGERVKARAYLERALQLFDQFSSNSDIYCELGELSDYCHELNDHYNAKRLLKKYLYYIDENYDKKDIEYLTAHAKELQGLRADGKWERFAEIARDISEALRNQITTNFTGMTAAQREYFIDQFIPLFDAVNEAVEEHPSKVLNRIGFENNMFLKGLLLRSERAVINSINKMGDRALSRRYEKFVSLSAELNTREYISGLGNAYRKSQLKDSIQILEKEIASKCRDFQRAQSGPLSIDDLSRTLEDNERALQIVEGKNTYFALLLDDSGNVSFYRIGSKSDISRHINDMGALYADNKLPHTYLGKLMSGLKDYTVYYTTSGGFNNIAVPSLKWDKSGTILGDIVRLRLVGSMEDIQAIKTRENSFNILAHNTVMWGGITYGDSATSSNVSVLRTIERGDMLHYLPGSLKEVADIHAELKAKGAKVSVYTGIHATEESFIKRSGKRDYILHISTHGFFNDASAFANPMRNSGLLFANSQKNWMAKMPSNTLSKTDGILRADEIATMDLSGCRLVVLSACQTGLGYHKSAEGVYGLQRAFKLAGAESVIMSLWRVDDNATAKLMKIFYAQLLVGDTPEKALNHARNALRDEGYSPSMWGAFVLLN